MNVFCVCVTKHYLDSVTVHSSLLISMVNSISLYSSLIQMYGLDMSHADGRIHMHAAVTAQHCFIFLQMFPLGSSAVLLVDIVSCIVWSLEIFLVST
jgi:hypothetical protein